jgi:hypothetical protein
MVDLTALAMKVSSPELNGNPVSSTTYMHTLFIRTRGINKNSVSVPTTMSKIKVVAELRTAAIAWSSVDKVL